MNFKLKEDKLGEVEMGPSDVLEIDKVFGPLVMTNLRVSIDVERCEWVVERKVIKNGPDGDIESWEVCARIDGQNSIEFRE